MKIDYQVSNFFTNWIVYHVWRRCDAFPDLVDFVKEYEFIKIKGDNDLVGQTILIIILLITTFV